MFLSYHIWLVGMVLLPVLKQYTGSKETSPPVVVVVMQPIIAEIVIETKVEFLSVDFLSGVPFNGFQETVPTLFRKRIRQFLDVLLRGPPYR